MNDLHHLSTSLSRTNVRRSLIRFLIARVVLTDFWTEILWEGIQAKLRLRSVASNFPSGTAMPKGVHLFTYD